MICFLYIKARVLFIMTLYLEASEKNSFTIQWVQREKQKNLNEVAFLGQTKKALLNSLWCLFYHMRESIRGCCLAAL